MKYYKVLVILFLVITIFSLSCEPDDICPESTPTTPNLIIRLYDISNPDSKKKVSKFKAQGVGKDAPLTDYNVVATDSIVLPLNTNDASTKYSFYKDYAVDGNGVITGNEDFITINYTREQVYVSRACGYKTIFKNVTITIESDSDNWIKLQESVNDNQSVEDEKAAHFKLFH